MNADEEPKIIFIDEGVGRISPHHNFILFIVHPRAFSSCALRITNYSLTFRENIYFSDINHNLKYYLDNTLLTLFNKMNLIIVYL